MKPSNGNSNAVMPFAYYNTILFWTLVFTLPISLIIDILYIPDFWWLITVGRISAAITGLKLHSTLVEQKAYTFLQAQFASCAFLYISVIMCLYGPHESKPLYLFLLCCVAILINTLSRMHTTNIIIYICVPTLLLVYCNRWFSFEQHEINKAYWFYFFMVSTSTYIVTYLRRKTMIQKNQARVWSYRRKENHEKTKFIYHRSRARKKVHEFLN